MNDFVASSVCWTIATSWRTSAAGRCRVLRRRGARRSGPGARCSSGSGPGRRASARAISRRRSSWASRTIRDTAGGIGAVARRSPAGAVAVRPRLGRRRRPPTTRAERLGVARRAPRGSRPSALRLPSRTSTWASISAARLVSEHELGVELGERPSGRSRRRRSRGAPSSASRRRRRAASRGGRPRSCAWVTRSSISSSSPSRRGQLVRQPRGELGQAGGRRRRRVGHRRGSVAASAVASISPPASGSSPGASRTRRPGSGR